MTKLDAIRKLHQTIIDTEIENLKQANPMTEHGKYSIARSQEAIRQSEFFLSPQCEKQLLDMTNEH